MFDDWSDSFVYRRKYELTVANCGENQTNSMSELSRISLYNACQADMTLQQ